MKNHCCRHFCAASLTHFLSLSHLILIFILFRPLSLNPDFPLSILPASFSQLFPSPLTLPSFLLLPPPFVPSSLFPPSGLSKDDGAGVNAESLEEVLNILAEEGSDWLNGFFTFLFDGPPLERDEAAAVKEEAGVTSDPREDQGPIKGDDADPQLGSPSTVDQ